MINWNLLANPANWLIVFLMLAVAIIGMTAIETRFAGQFGATPQGN